MTIQKLSDGALRFTFKDGRSLDSLQPLRSAQSAFEAGVRPDDALQSAQNAENTPTAPQADWTDLFATHKAMDIVIDSKTAVTLWTGEHMDYSTATGALLYLARGCKPPTFIPNVSAETPTQSTPEHVSAETPDHSRAQCQ